MSDWTAETRQIRTTNSILEEKEQGHKNRNDARIKTQKKKRSIKEIKETSSAHWGADHVGIAAQKIGGGGGLKSTPLHTARSRSDKLGPHSVSGVGRPNCLGRRLNQRPLPPTAPLNGPSLGPDIATHQLTRYHRPPPPSFRFPSPAG